LRVKTLRKAIAKSLPFFVRRLTPRPIAQHLYFDGTFHARLYGTKTLQLNHESHQIENEIYWKGFEDCHEGTSTRIWVELIRRIQPNVIWDVGANSGTYGLLAKALNPSAEVHFFEPLPRAILMIKENLFLNKFSCYVHEYGLGEFDGEAQIFLPKGNDFPTSVTVNWNSTGQGDEADTLVIEVCRAETVISKGTANIPALVKMDVETYEPEVLAGFGTFFPKSGIFLIEILSDELALRLQEFFPESDYDFYNIDDQKGSFYKTRQLGKSTHYNCLILPKILNKSVELKSIKGFTDRGS
jgi:FkbM family methyltransferase